jgi:hypothetical protein
MPQTIDYDAIANKYGGVRTSQATSGSYDSIAAKYGGKRGETPEEKPGLLQRAWNAVNEGIVSPDFFQRAISGMTRDQVDEEMKVLPEDSPRRAGLKTFFSGASKDASNTLSGLTSPLGIATMLSGAAGKIPGAIGSLYRSATGAASVGMGVKGAYDAATSDPMSGDPAEVSKFLQGASMAAGGAAGALASGTPSANAVLDRLPEKMRGKAIETYQKTLNPTKERTKYLAEKRTPEMLNRKIRFDSPKALAEGATEQARVNTKTLNDIYDNLPSSRESQTKPMLEAMDRYIQQFQDVAPDGSIIDIDPHAVAAANSLKETLAQYGDTISPKSMRRVRQIYDDSVARSGGYEGKSLADGSMLEAKREMASAIREQLAKDNPEIAPINSEINFWLDVQKIAKETARRRVGQQGGLTVDMAKRTGQVIGAGAGGAVGGLPGAGAGAYIGGEAAAHLARLTRSPRWRTLSAVTRNELANSIAAGNQARLQGNLQFVERKMMATGDQQKNK